MDDTACKEAAIAILQYTRNGNFDRRFPWITSEDVEFIAREIREHDEIRAELFFLELMQAHGESIVAAANGVYFKRGKYGYTKDPIHQ